MVPVVPVVPLVPEVPPVPGVASLPPLPPPLEMATPAAITPALIARPVPTVTPPTSGVDSVRLEVALGTAALAAGVVSAAIRGRLMEVARTKARSCFTIMLL